MTTMNEHDESYHHHHNDDEVCKDYDNETSQRDVSGNCHQQEQEDSSSSLSLEWLLQCPLSFERMQDPVVLFPSGHSYDRQFLCASLLYYPNLDPKSGVYYKEPLRYTTNYALRNVLQERDQLVPYDDSDFGAAYKQAWQDNAGQQQTNDDDDDYDFLDDDNHGMGAAQHRHDHRRHYHHHRKQQQQQRSSMMRQIYQAAAVILLVTAISVGVCRAAAAERAAIQRARQCQLLRTWNPALAWYEC